MKVIVIFVPLFALVVALSGCATVPSCSDAARLRTAALFTLQTLDRVCPMTR